MEVVEEVVETLTGPPEGADETRESLADQMRRAAKEFDARTAEKIADALLEKLDDDPSGVRELETLMILGLAHPSVLEEHKVPLIQEGRRLALLLERSGEIERAQSLLEVLSKRLPDDRSVQHDLASLMRRNGNSEHLVERYMANAEEALRHKQTADAIAWLQEALMVDRSRRDVARMIRDLRYQQADRRVKNKRRIQLVAVSTVVLLMASGVVWRERSFGHHYESIPVAAEGDMGSLRARLSSIDGLIADQHLWVGVFRAQSERTRLKQQIGILESKLAELELRAHQEREARLIAAEAARLKGRELVQRGEFEQALVRFEEALGLGPEDWELRPRTEADVEAIREHIQESAE